MTNTLTFPDQDFAVEGVLASFPRSGRTWLAGMISEVVMKSLPERRKNVRAFVTDLSDATVAEWRNALGDREPPPLRIATHDKYDPKIHVKPIVLVCRQPEDSMVSYFHYQSGHQNTFDGNLDDFLRNAGVGVNRLANWYNSWAEVTDGCTTVTYESLRRDTAGELDRVLNAFGIEHELDLDALVERWEFSNRQSLEKKRQPEAAPNALFVRAGEIGGGINEFSDDQAAFFHQELSKKLTSRAHRLLSTLGYTNLG